MKIIHLLPSIDFGGTERIVLSLANIQQLNGHDVTIISFTKNNGYPEISDGLKILHLTTISVIWKWNNTISTHIDLLEKTIKKINPDIIHSHSYWTELMLYSMPKIANAQYVTHFHLFYPFYQSLSIINPAYIGHKFLKHRLYRAYEKYETTFITVSKSTYQYYFKHFPKKIRSKIHSIPNGIEILPFSYTPSQKKINFNILSVGRLSADKNYPFIIKIAQQLKFQGFNFLWKIAGEGVLKDELIEMVNNLELNDVITFLGQVSDIHFLYRTSDILIHTSKKESFGLIFLEAMSAGLPSISFRAEGNEELITHNVEGCLLNNDTSEEDFSKAIVKILRNPSKYEYYRKNGLKKSQNFSLESYYYKILELYSKD